METVEAGALVLVHCSSPKEKLWGVLLRLDAVGLVVRGLDLNSVEDWLHQELTGAGDRLIVPSTQFIPTHRVERVYLDASGGPVPSFSDRFRAASGRDVRDALTAPPDGPPQ